MTADVKKEPGRFIKWLSDRAWEIFLPILDGFQMELKELTEDVARLEAKVEALETWKTAVLEEKNFMEGHGG